MNTYILLGIKIFTAIVLAVIFGNGSVVMFNRIPTHWFEEIGEDGQKSLPPELQDLGDGTQLLMGVHALTLALRKRLEKNHTLPLIPYGFAALTVYFLFLWDVISFIIF